MCFFALQRPVRDAARELGEVYHPAQAEKNVHSTKLQRRHASEKSTGANSGQKCANRFGVDIFFNKDRHWIADVYDEFRQLLVEWQQDGRSEVKWRASRLKACARMCSASRNLSSQHAKCTSKVFLQVFRACLLTSPNTCPISLSGWLFRLPTRGTHGGVRGNPGIVGEAWHTKRNRRRSGLTSTTPSLLGALPSGAIEGADRKHTQQHKTCAHKHSKAARN